MSNQKDELRELVEKAGVMLADEEIVCGTKHIGTFAYLNAIRERLSRSESALRPKIVCLCGSTRFMDAFFDQGWKETLAGNIVLSVGVWREGPADHAGEWIGEDVKEKLDELHKRKIDLADEVMVLNVGGYIGKSTRSEIDYAIAHNKPIRYLERLAAP